MKEAKEDLKNKIYEISEKIKEREGNKKLTSLERAKKVYNFNEDIEHAFGGFAFFDPKAVGITNISTRSFYTNPEAVVYCSLMAVDKYEHDIPSPKVDLYQIDVEACGSSLSYPDNSMPVIKDYIIKDKKDLNKLKIPDPNIAARMPYVIETASIFKEKVGDFYKVSVGTCAPFSGIVGLRGFHSLVVDIKKDPLFVHELLEYILEVQIEYNKAIIKATGIAPSIADAWAAPPNLSPEQFYEFAYPYSTRLLSTIKEYSGKPGNWNLGWGFSIPKDKNSFLRRFNATGTATCNIFEEEIIGQAQYNQINLQETKKICYEQKVVLSTNLMPQRIHSGPPEEITKTVNDLHNICGRGGGHAYYTTIPVGTPEKNILAYSEALKHCKYPIESN